MRAGIHTVISNLRCPIDGEFWTLIWKRAKYAQSWRHTFQDAVLDHSKVEEVLTLGYVSAVRALEVLEQLELVDLIPRAMTDRIDRVVVLKRTLSSEDMAAVGLLLEDRL